MSRFGVRIGWRKYLYECTPFGYVNLWNECILVQWKKKSKKGSSSLNEQSDRSYYYTISGNIVESTWSISFRGIRQWQVGSDKCQVASFLFYHAYHTNPFFPLTVGVLMMNLMSAQMLATCWSPCNRSLRYSMLRGMSASPQRSSTGCTNRRSSCHHLRSTLSVNGKHGGDTSGYLPTFRGRILSWIKGSRQHQWLTGLAH